MCRKTGSPFWETERTAHRQVAFRVLHGQALAFNSEEDPVTQRNRRKALTRKSASVLAHHILTLATQATEQVLQVALTLDALTSMETDKQLLPLSQTAAVLQALETEMKHHLKALALTIDALHVCAENAVSHS